MLFGLPRGSGWSVGESNQSRDILPDMCMCRGECDVRGVCKSGARNANAKLGLLMNRIAVICVMIAVECWADNSCFYAYVERAGKTFSITEEMSTMAQKSGIDKAVMVNRIATFLKAMNMFFERDERESLLYRWSNTGTNEYLVALKYVARSEISLAAQFHEALQTNRLYMYWNINNGPTVQIERLQDPGRELLYAGIFHSANDHLPFWLFGQDEALREYFEHAHKMTSSENMPDGPVLKVRTGDVEGEIAGKRNLNGRIDRWEFRINGELFQRIIHTDYQTNDVVYPRLTTVEYFIFGGSKPIKNERYYVEWASDCLIQPWNAIIPFGNRSVIHGHDYRTYEDIIVDTNLNYEVRKRK